MLRPRIIPCLLVRNKGLVKTVRFGDGKYVGDPINAVRIFNEKEADELMILDIDATVQNREPDMATIQKWAAECRMPLCYGGGVQTVGQAKSIVGLGVEKVALSSAAIERPALVSELARDVGSQSVVVVLDVRENSRGGHEVFTHNGSRSTGRSVLEWTAELQDRGAGEIIVNSIDRDGMMEGYDVALARAVRGVARVPVTLLGGAGSLAHVGALFAEFGVMGAAAGSIFVFKGVYKAVLINYPTREVKDRLIKESLAH